ncbi:MAG: choice-of-anchor J domain-containing protein [Muribaculaceae bacterium]|nr:choice-of-anchor J domain-containing protein [Muribaculaceae bacterium]
MKKFLLSFCAVVAAFGMACASETTYNVNDAENLKGEDIAETKKDDGSVQAARHIQPLESFNLDEFMFTFTDGGGKTAPAYYWATSTNANQQRTVRLYASNTCTITAPEGTSITKIDFKGSNAGSNLAFTVNTGSMTLSGNNATWSGNTNSLTFGVSASWRFTELTITTGEGGGNQGGGDTGETKVLWTGLAQTANDTDFTFENVVLPAEATYIWSWKSYNGAYYLNASAFVQNVAYASEAYAISPVIDLTGATGNITATFEHAAKFQTTLKDLCGLVVRTEGTTEWTKLAVPEWPVAGGWDFANSGNIDLSAYAGKKIQLAFKYGSTADGADTWEIRNLIITGEGEGGYTPDPTPTNPAFEKVTSITSGEGYIFVIGNQYGAPIAATATYGRLNLTNGEVSGNTFYAPENAAITIAQTANGYTLVDAEGRFLGMDAAYLTSFQLYTEANSGCYWNATFNGDAVTFTNTLTGCIVCQSLGANGTPYTNIAPAVVADGQVLPTLYKKADESGIVEVATDVDAAPVYYNLQGVQVANPEHGLYIVRQGNKVSKVLVK